jgi:uncharacterized protein (DUF1015 family)
LPAIRPFKAVIYNRDTVKDMARVVAPPYDIIPPAMQNELYRKHPENIVRLILGKIRPGDTADDNRYTRAKRDYSEWLKDRILVRDGRDAIYIYTQIYADGKKRIERTGFIALMALEMGDRRTVLPHENTLHAPKADRLNLIRSVKANLSPIFVLYEDPAHQVLKVIRDEISGRKPFLDVTFDRARHKVWRIDSPDAIKVIEGLMLPRNIFIADGHHRYETSRNYANELDAAGADARLKANARFLMAYFVESDEGMLTILPAHRLIKNTGGLGLKDILERLKRHFLIRKAPSLTACLAGMARLKNFHAFGMYAGKNDFYLLKLKDEKAIDAAISANSADWRRLDVTILHLFLLEHTLGIKDDEENIEYVKDPRETARFVKSGKFKIAFFLNPTKVSEVKRIASLGEKMPRKATYFYPKPLSGLVINKLD